MAAAAGVDSAAPTTLFSSRGDSAADSARTNGLLGREPGADSRDSLSRLLPTLTPATAQSIDDLVVAAAGEGLALVRIPAVLEEPQPMHPFLPPLEHAPSPGGTVRVLVQ